LSIEIGECLSRSQMNPFNRHKKTHNTRRNEWHRGKRKRLEGHLIMSQWVMLPVDPNDPRRGDMNAEPLMEVQLRKQEADFTNYFNIENGQPQRLEKKSEWITNKWNKKKVDIST